MISKKILEKLLAHWGMENIPVSNVYYEGSNQVSENEFQVGEDFIESVKNAKGADFAFRHIQKRDGSYYADLPKMNEDILRSAGITAIDVIPECTRCKPFLYHSHRATGGVRGTMGAVSGIV